MNKNSNGIKKFIASYKQLNSPFTSAFCARRQNSFTAKFILRGFERFCSTVAIFLNLKWIDTQLFDFVISLILCSKPFDYLIEL
ncbi:MAG: hypothetical protein ACRC9I_12525 [Acinetobacter sp.]